jgi:hypothetical protein
MCLFPGNDGVRSVLHGAFATLDVDRLLRLLFGCFCAGWGCAGGGGSGVGGEEGGGSVFVSAFV